MTDGDSNEVKPAKTHKVGKRHTRVALESLKERLDRATRAVPSRWQMLLPWVSLLWGLGTSFLIARNISQPGHLILAGLFFVTAGWLLQRLYFWREREGHRVVDLLSSMALQSAAQYVLLFAIPFLYFAQRWAPLTFSVLLAAIALWDPWWLRWHRHPTFLMVLRQWVAALVVAALVVVLLPFAMGFLILIIVAVSLIVVDWSHLLESGRRISGAELGLRQRAVRVAVVLILPALGIVQHVTAGTVPFAPVAVWLANPGFTRGRPIFVEREGFTERVAHWAPPLSGPASEGGEPDIELCCVTPLLAGLGFEAGVSHVWYVDGDLVDTIDLRTARGNGEQAAFRTFSCKKKFPQIQPGSRISCKALAAGCVYLGGAGLDVLDGAGQ